MQRRWPPSPGYGSSRIACPTAFAVSSFHLCAPIAKAPERPYGLRALIPGPRAVGHDNALFVTLPCQKDDVAGPSTLECGLDCLPSIGDAEQVLPCPHPASFFARRAPPPEVSVFIISRGLHPHTYP